VRQPCIGGRIELCGDERNTPNIWSRPVRQEHHPVALEVMEQAVVVPIGA